jgi:hypothetical protein
VQTIICGRESWDHHWHSQDTSGAALTHASVKRGIKRYRKDKDWLCLGVWTNPALA